MANGIRDLPDDELTKEIKFIIGEELDEPSLQTSGINSYMVLRVMGAIEWAGFRRVDNG